MAGLLVIRVEGARGFKLCKVRIRWAALALSLYVQLRCLPVWFWAVCPLSSLCFGFYSALTIDCGVVLLHR